ncbi:MAG: hypothetical protein HC887_09950 [Desulfobacteraceae bacterium]|nr:hypothetical protein [Desulfobacteraceae bacterium]
MEDITRQNGSTDTLWTSLLIMKRPSITLTTGEAEQERYFDARDSWDYFRKLNPTQRWIHKQYAKMVRNTRPVFNLSGRYYEEDQWEDPVDKWSARYQVYGARSWAFYPVNNTTWYSIHAAYQFYKLTDLLNENNLYFIDVGRGYSEVRRVHSTCLYSLAGLGVTTYGPYGRSCYCPRTGVAIESELPCGKNFRTDGGSNTDSVEQTD